MNTRQRAIRALVRGVAAGFAGTAVMTATAAAYAWLRGPVRPDHEGVTPVVDFDNSDHVVIAAGTILQHHLSSPAGRHALFHLVHWGYGSAVGIARVLLGRTREPAATVVFLLGCQTMACTLFPIAGDTPPPWRWSREQLAVSIAQHAIYATTVSTAWTLLRRKPI